MSNELPILNRSSIPNPCPMAWDDMNGDDKSRHCSQCDKSVYHLSNRTAQEASKLIAEHGGNLCVQGIFRVSDGTLITRPTRKQRFGRFARRMVVAAVALPLVTILSGCGEKNLSSKLGSWADSQDAESQDVAGNMEQEEGGYYLPMEPEQAEPGPADGAE